MILPGVYVSTSPGMVIHVTTLSVVGFSETFNAVSPNWLSKPPQYNSEGLPTANIWAKSAGSAPSIIIAGDSTSPDDKLSGPQGSEAIVSVLGLDPDKNSSQLVVT